MDLANTTGYVPGFPDTLALRELGGMQAADGRRVRRGLLYRGSALTGLTASELARVDGFGLRFILDLRAAGEVEGREDHVPLGCEYVRQAGMRDDEGNEVDFSPRGIESLQKQFAAKGTAFMRSLYVSMMFGNPATHVLVDHLVDGVAPLYFHCTAGKDRTGVCAAVVLMLLGVPDGEIVREFLLTNEYRASIINMAPEDLPAGISDQDRENWAQINGVRAEDLQACLDAVDERFATREAYFQEEFGLDAQALANLRDRYLE